ncbi:uncharacterized protein LOC131882504 [Tigriopus californicus]|uniref:uncharacterized protein LOC131882504 n=1 Tax=Tigriopus californicus TaxID=6832 RepID=UPI0027DA9EEE|nr:uncharacterized protein LOC131882504 [Tigriopus californicus]
MKSDPPPQRPFESVRADLFEYGGRYFLAFVDRYSGWPCYDSYGKAPSTTEVVKSLKTIFTQYGIPIKMRTDVGSQFASTEFMKFCHKEKVHLMISSAFYAQSNGHAEAAVKMLKGLVKNIGYVDDWTVRHLMLPFLNGGMFRTRMDCHPPNGYLATDFEPVFPHFNRVI